MANYVVWEIRVKSEVPLVQLDTMLDPVWEFFGVIPFCWSEAKGEDIMRLETDHYVSYAEVIGLFCSMTESYPQLRLQLRIYDGEELCFNFYRGNYEQLKQETMFKEPVHVFY